MESELLSHQKTAGTSRLFLASVIAMLPGFTFGGLLAYLAMGVPQLMTPNSTGILIDLYQASWLMSLSQPTRMVGTLFTGFLQDKIGRKKCLLLCSVCQCVGCILIYLSTSYITLLLALCVTGFTTGLALLPSYSILSEISLIRLRGSLGSLNTLNANGGYMFGLVLAILVPVHVLSLVLMIPSIIFLLTCYILPESPVWLARQGRDQEAKSVLQWLRGKTYCINLEVKDMEAVLCEEAAAREMDQSRKTGILTDRTFILPLMVVCSLFIIQALSGCDTMCYYVITIFADLGMQPSNVALIFQATITLGYLVSPVIMARINTRPQFVVALVAMAVTQGVMGLSFLVPSFSSLSIPCLILAGLCYGMGVGPVPFVTMSALFPQKYRSMGVSAGQVTRAVMVCLQLKVFPYLIEWMGLEGVFFSHSVFLVLGAVFAVLMLPETRNKSQYQLESIFSKNGKSEGCGEVE